MTSETYWAIRRRKIAQANAPVVEEVKVKKAKKAKKPAKNDATVKVDGEKVEADTSPESNDADVTIEPA